MADMRQRAGLVDQPPDQDTSPREVQVPRWPGLRFTVVSLGPETVYARYYLTLRGWIWTETQRVWGNAYLFHYQSGDGVLEVLKLTGQHGVEHWTQMPSDGHDLLDGAIAWMRDDDGGYGDGDADD